MDICVQINHVWLLTDGSGDLLQSDNHPTLLVVDPHTGYGSNQTASCQDHPSTEYLVESMFDPLALATRPGAIPAPSPRIEITPWSDPLSSQNLEQSLGVKALRDYRECVSPASSNSSTGWPAETYSPSASPCVSPSIGGCDMGLSGLDIQGIHTSSAHSSPGASPRNSVTEDTFLLPQHQRTTSSTQHQRSRSASPHGKRSYDPANSCQGATPVKQRSRSPSPIPSPREQQGTCYYQPQAQTTSTGLEEMLSSLTSRVMPTAVVLDQHGQAQRQDCVYREVGRAGADVKSETIYMLPAVWPPPHPVQHRAFRFVVCPFLLPTEHLCFTNKLKCKHK